MTIDATVVQELLDREAIRDCLTRYAHAVDRGDEAMLRAVYWPGATDDQLSRPAPRAAGVPRRA